MKRIFAIALLLGLLFSGCTAAPEPTATTQTTAPATTAAPTTEPTGPKDREDTRLAILLPEDANWAAAGEDLQMLLQNLHYQVELMYADSDAWEQAQQLSQVLEWADGIIIAPVESAALTEVCLQVKEKELPLFSYDRIHAMSNDTLIYELYDTMLGEADLSRLDRVKEAAVSLPDHDPGEHWYDSIKLPQSLSKKGKKGNREAFDRLAMDYLEAFLDSAADAPLCEPIPKMEKASVYVEGLLSHGGPSTDVFKKGLGDEKTAHLFRNILFGTGRI